jgi:molecular chaperone GrpE
MTENIDVSTGDQSAENESAVTEVRDDADLGKKPEAADAAAESIDELAAAQQAAEENHNKYLRLAAEMENLRKRTIRDVETARKYGIERFATEILAVIDSLEMGLQAAPTASMDSFLEGQQATYKLLLGAVEKYGIEVIDPEGEPFDPQMHEAMTMQPSNTAEPGSVLAVIQKGYQLNNRLLRPARVVVASEPDNSAE